MGELLEEATGIAMEQLDSAQTATNETRMATGGN
jgi:hypothetical protein